MADNPYEAPRSPVLEVQPAGSPIKAVLAGVGVWLAGCVVISVIIGVLFSAIYTRRGMSAEQIDKAITAGGPYSAPALLGTVLGCIVTVLCGYVCARLSRRRDYALCSILIAMDIIVTLYFSWSDYTAVEHVIFAGLSVFTIMLGTRLGMPAMRS